VTLTLLIIGLIIGCLTGGVVADETAMRDEREMRCVSCCFSPRRRRGPVAGAIFLAACGSRFAKAFRRNGPRFGFFSAAAADERRFGGFNLFPAVAGPLLACLLGFVVARLSSRD